MVEKIQSLMQIIEQASDAYYNGTPIMADSQFDFLVQQLREVSPNNKILKQIGAEPRKISPLQKVKHRIPMGSLNNAKDEEEFLKWYNKIASPHVSVQHKLDGVSIDLVYQDGKFVQAITRGDGVIGEDVTHTIKNASFLPNHIPQGEIGQISVRCEAMILKETFEKYFKDAANPRNAAAGIVRRKDGKNSQYLVVYAFDVCLPSELLMSEASKLDILEGLGFTVVKHEEVNPNQFPELLFYYNEMIEERDDLPYEIDGMVVKVDDWKIQEELGESDGRPKWAVAWKFPPRGGKTILEKVELSVGQSGNITPLAKVRPVRVGGTTIKSVNLCNWDEIERLDIAIGDEVEVVRAGDVIPKITRVITRTDDRKTIEEPVKCPVCLVPVVKEGVAFKCPNLQCSARMGGRIKTWLKKRNILYIGERTIEKMDYYSLVDLYTMTDEQLMKDLGIGKIMMKKVRKELEKSRNVSIGDFIGSIGIDGLGRTIANRLVGGGIDSIPKWLNITIEELLEHEGIQEKTAHKLYAGIKENLYFIIELSKQMNFREINKSDSRLAGKSFCFTGKMEHGRKELQQMVADNGGKSVSSVGKGLDYLVQADPGSQSGKSQKAQKYGTKIISELEFLVMIDVKHGVEAFEDSVKKSTISGLFE